MRNGRPTRNESDMRRRLFAELVAEGRRYREAAKLVGLKAETALGHLEDPAFHAEVVAIHRERVA